MARFYGKVGFGIEVKVAPGVVEKQIIERPYYGDVIRNTRGLTETENLNKNLRVGNSISIVADPYANENFFAMTYIWWMGTRWTISDVEVSTSGPRLTIRLGEVYNGPDAT